MKRVKVTVSAIVTLAPGMELIEDFVSDGENLGAHLKVGGKLYCPEIEWMVFEPPMTLTENGEVMQFGNGYSSDEESDDWFFDGPVAPRIDHTIETLEE